MIVAMAALPWECSALRQHLRSIRRWEVCGRFRAWQGLAGNEPIVLVQTGVGLVRAQEAAELALRKLRAKWVLSFGCAGGLDPALRPGTLVLAERVVHGPTETALPVHATIGQRFVVLAREAGIPVHRGTALSTAEPLLTALEKARAARRFPALAVDMESAAIAAVAEREGVPFVYIRAILDPADYGLPEASLVDAESGRVRPGAVLRYLWRRPSAVVELQRLAALKRSAEEALQHFFAAWIESETRQLALHTGKVD